MMLAITENQMTLHADGVTLASAVRRPNGKWDVSTWLVPLDRNQAITALTITEMLARGCPTDHPLVATLWDELR
jgi:hypothetical protein